MLRSKVLSHNSSQATANVLFPLIADPYVSLRNADRAGFRHDCPMKHEWVPQTPDDLRRDANKLQAIAVLVCRPDVACHLREHAAALLAEAELKVAAERI